MSINQHFVYILYGISKKNPNQSKYYIGYTNNLSRRIRQHNRELMGGAKATSGYSWIFHGYISGFQNQKSGLQAEWRLKHAAGKKRNMIERIIQFYEYVEIYHTVSPNGEDFDGEVLDFYLESSLYDSVMLKKEGEGHILYFHKMDEKN